MEFSKEAELKRLEEKREMVFKLFGGKNVESLDSAIEKIKIQIEEKYNIGE